MPRRKDVLISPKYLRELTQRGKTRLFNQGNLELKKLPPPEEWLPRKLESWADSGKQFAIIAELFDGDFYDITRSLQLCGKAKEIQDFCDKHHLKTNVVRFTDTLGKTFMALVAEW